MQELKIFFYFLISENTLDRQDHSYSFDTQSQNKMWKPAQENTPHRNSSCYFEEGQTGSCHDFSYPQAEAYICEVCSKVCKTASTLYCHRQTHLPPKYTCPVCQQKIHLKSNFKRHLKNVHKMACCFHCSDVYSIDKLTPHICAS